MTERICTRGHRYSTENAPAWLGGRCPVCRAIGKKAWESRYLRVILSGSTAARFPKTPDGVAKWEYFQGLIAEHRAQMAEKYGTRASAA